MNPNHGGRLGKLLFESERELVNIKLFPGTDPDLTKDQLSETAASVIEDAVRNPPVHRPPNTGQQKMTLSEFRSRKFG